MPLTDQEREELHKKIEGSLEAKIVSIEQRLLGCTKKKPWESLKEKWVELVFQIGAVVFVLILAFWKLNLSIVMLQRDVNDLKTNNIASLTTMIQENKEKNIEQDKLIQDILLKIENILTRMDR